MPKLTEAYIGAAPKAIVLADLYKKASMASATLVGTPEAFMTALTTTTI